jgi:hypothetical protein
LDSGNLEIFRRVLLEITKRRRFGDDFAPAPRFMSRRRLRAVLFGVLVFRFSISNKTRINPFWFGEIYRVSAKRVHVVFAQLPTRPLNFGRQRTPEDRRAATLAPFSGNFKQNRSGTE